MAAYKQQYYTWIGHSVNDTPPVASAVTGYFKYDTDLIILSYSNGTSWIPISYGTTNPLNVTKNVIFNGKYGSYMTNSMVIRGEGVMEDLAPFGATFTPNGIDGNGTNHAFASGSTVIQNTGIGILRPVGAFAGFTRSSNNPSYFIKFSNPGRTGTDLRFFSGYPTTTAGMLIGEDPIDQANGGVVVGHNSTDTNFNVWHGNATNPITKVELSPAVPVPTGVTSYSVEIRLTSSSNAVVSLYSGSTNLLLGSRTLTTNLPISTKTLNWQHVIQNPSTTNKSMSIYGAHMELAR